MRRRGILAAGAIALSAALAALGFGGMPAQAQARSSMLPAAAPEPGYRLVVAARASGLDVQAFFGGLSRFLEVYEGVAGWQAGWGGTAGRLRLRAEQRPAGAPVVFLVSPASGSAGDRVAISGSGLRGVTSVRFGAEPAEFRVVSDRLIVALVPQGTGTVDVVVSGPAGTSPRTASDRFTYFDLTAIQSAVSATVRLDVSGGGQDASCSGVLVSSSPAVVLTARHCVDWLAAPQEASYTATFYPPAGSGVTLPARLLLTDEPHDLAALLLQSEPPVEPVAVRSDAPAAGETVYDVGYPGGVATPVVKAGQVLLPHVPQVPVSGSSVPDMTVTDVAVQAGDSGGPLVDAKGRLVGILTGGTFYRSRGLRAAGTSVFTWAPEVASFAVKAEAAAREARVAAGT
ncbi:MAG: trypsin-like peptidase domain-containing protein [Bacillota bacterium]|nr:trypsin-like peptidase domain-containing protein [Bacillota bacterium]